MVAGNRHACGRDSGSLAGGLYATAALSSSDLDELKQLACALSSTPDLASRRWDEGVEYGKSKPVEWNESDYQVHSRRDPGRSLEWDDEIGGNEKIFDPRWVEDEDVTPPTDAQWCPVTDLIQYLSTLFDGEDLVGYVTESWYNVDADKHLPTKGNWDRTAKELISKLNNCNGDIGSVFGDTNPDVGAWIRFNPLDGVGIKDANVTRFKYALVESDVVEIPTQYALMKKLELPIKAVVHSGGKSLHAIVRIDADSIEQYRERVDFLYKVCGRHGLEMDRQNRNPSRLSRMPGVTRRGNKQFLLARDIGRAGWDEWRQWIEDINDDLPNIESLDIGDEEPEVAPELIHGLLRQGHKLLLAGPSKAGKSFCLQQLAIAVSQGSEWMGWQCTQGNVLYVNLELDAKSNKHRFWKIHKELDIKTNGNIDVWNLRGNAATLDKLAPKLIRRSENKKYALVIIDPIYKVLTGDENSAQEMAHFCNQFDKICIKMGSSVAYCHHHSKGAQGQKSSKDRSSGSGVFARDPDAIMDLIELIIDDARRKQITQKWVREVLAVEMTKAAPGWYEKMSQDDCLIPEKIQEYAIENKIDYDYGPVSIETNKSLITSGWRVSSTLREFATPPAKEVFFKYPLHLVDHDGLLKDAKSEGEETPYQKFSNAKENYNKERKITADDKWETAFEMTQSDQGTVHKTTLAKANDSTEQAAYKWARKHPDFDIKEGVIFRVEPSKNEVEDSK